jgi:hypothetical protein
VTDRCVPQPDSPSGPHTSHSLGPKLRRSRLRLGRPTASGGLERVEVEEEWMSTKLKALTCYFGGLAEGQVHMF